MQDHYELSRFVEAQNPVLPTVLDELRRGQKRSHWIWFIFPQVEGLGHSPTAQRYSIHERAEAVAYLSHPLLGPRLIECTLTVLGTSGRSAHDIFGSPDNLKFRSSMTLFDAVSEQELFSTALAHFFQGERDEATLGILRRWALNR